MNSRWDILVAFAKHGLDAEFSERGDGLHCKHKGHTLSLQWGYVNYCQNRYKGAWDQKMPYTKNFEMGLWGDADGKFFDFAGDGVDFVMGWVPWENLDDILRAFKIGAYEYIGRVAYGDEGGKA